ncbi:MAG: glycosyltransferase family 2 protein [Gammaproteobacteria bacterium]|nr:glycosyltransferase family 2 protein [Gammaproteobacteria bacterium]
MQLLFWSAFAFVAYTYLGYPLLVWLISRFVPERRPDPSTVRTWPKVCVIVAGYNEQDRVARKIRNLKALDYPPEQRRIIFVSDGSTDETPVRITHEGGVDLIAYNARRGKPHALNRAVEAAGDAEILVFTDVRQELSVDAVRILVTRLVNERDVGGVSGELVHIDPQSHTAANIGLYWRYEKWIRKSESRIGSTVGATGALYAIWREDYTVLPDDTLLDDVVIPLGVVRRGRRVVLEERAVIYDELQKESAGERRRKIRTLTGNFQAFTRLPWVFVPWRNPVFIQLLSHKLFRLFVPYALALMLVASLLADGLFYRMLAVGQIAFYLLPALGLVSQRLRSHRLISFVLVFLELNWAAVLALRNFLLSRTNVWEKT